jgi:hypothetical protein
LGGQVLARWPEQDVIHSVVMGLVNGNALKLTVQSRIAWDRLAISWVVG